MANPQRENGHTDLANEIIDHLALQNLSGSEFQILLVLFRKTYGWNKKEDQISLTQFQKATNLPRWTVWQAIEKLIKKNLLVKKNLLPVSMYTFNKDWEAWLPSKQNITRVVRETLLEPTVSALNKERTGSKQNMTSHVLPTEVVMFYQQGSKQNMTHKRHYTKTIITKDKRLTTMSVSDPYFSFSPEVFQKLWNDTLAPHGFPRCTTLDHKENNKPKTKTRQQILTERLREKSCPSYWLYIFSKILNSAFCRGENERNWKANIDWLIRPTTHTKIVEGKYDEKSVVAPPY